MVGLDMNYSGVRVNQYVSSLNGNGNNFVTIDNCSKVNYVD